MGNGAQEKRGRDGSWGIGLGLVGFGLVSRLNIVEAE